MGVLRNTLLLTTLIFSNGVSADINESLNKLTTIHQTVDENKKTRIMYFWASWCPDCRDKLSGKIQKLENNNVEIVTVNVDRKAKKGMRYVEESNLALPVLRDEDKSLRKELKVFSVPSWAVIKKNKNNKWDLVKVSGGSDLEEIKKSL